MNDIAIRAEGLGKRYRLQAAAGGRAGYRTFREELVGLPARLMAACGAARAKEVFWALRDVSFEVKRGEVLGVIGRNGAGKSTLLKILSRIVDPSEGTVDIYGRVGSLLEVGTGFHPELTGRENIFLSGALLGMRRSEVRAHFNEIVAFAGVERFVDQPVKNYSSGMYARLGFAVAAHLRAEILLVDEVLAVGDFEFQRRCIAKIGEVGESGRTVLLVTHDLGVIQRLASRVLLMSDGRADFVGAAESAVARMLAKSQGARTNEWRAEDDVVNDESATPRLLSARVDVTEAADTLGFGLRFSFRVYAARACPGASIGVGMDDEFGGRLATLFSSFTAESMDLRTGVNEAVCTVASAPLKPGRYLLSLHLSAGPVVFHHMEHAMELLIDETITHGFITMPNAEQGVWLLGQRWRMEP